MALFAIVIALLLEQARPLAPGNRVTAGLSAWARAVGRNVDAGGVQHGWLAWALAAALPALAAAGVYGLLGWLGGWPLELAWNVLILYFTLGLRQFSDRFTRIHDALNAGNEDRARKLLARWQQTDAAALPGSEIVRHMIEYSVLTAHRCVFGVLLWFCVLAALGLGPAGAVFYRSAGFALRYWRRRSQAATQPVSPALVQVARQAWRAVDWLPARCTALGFAVVGSFEDAVDAWRNHAARFADPNDGVVLAATAGALGVRLGGAAGEGLPGLPPGPAHLTQVIGLLWRMMALWLLLLVLLTLARVMG
ncbi:MAG: cobalamin biosynthesis protein [Desulfovibrionaceae bacterium]|jgi:adenosylcobinamide-phosphate synthase|nr:cobalamin biosynthesis protein [Desulfovibrionaceae bacterium]